MAMSFCSGRFGFLYFHDSHYLTRHYLSLDLSCRRCYRKIRVNTARAGPYSVKLVSQCARELDMEVVPRVKPDCDLYWHRRDYLAQEVPHGAYVSSTPGIKEVFSKSVLASLLNRMQWIFPAEYQFYPRSWKFPEERRELDTYIKRKTELGDSPTFILKPSYGSLGVNIFLFKDLNDVVYSESAVVQEYVSNPLLVEGVKFDLRLYVLIASYNPLEVYITSTGLTRFCTVPYEAPTVHNLNNDYMHLTNYAINKENSSYSLDTGKRTVADTLDMLSEDYDAGTFWVDVKDVVAKTLIAVLPALHIESRSYILERQLQGPLCCFQLLGFDLMLDEDYKLHLLEVNSNPSQAMVYEKTISPGVEETLSSDIDFEIKKQFMSDCLKIIGRKILKHGGDVAVDTSYSVVPLNYPDLMLLEHCRKLFFSLTDGLKLNLSDFIEFTKKFKLVTSEQFKLDDVHILFNSLSTEDGLLSFEDFILALQKLSQRLNGDKSIRNELWDILRYCQVADV